MVTVPSGAYGVVGRPTPILNLHGVWFCQLLRSSWWHVGQLENTGELEAREDVSEAADAQSRLVRQRIPTSLKRPPAGEGRSCFELADLGKP